MAAPPPLLLVLHSKAEFVRGNIAAGKVPSAPQTAAFIREVVNALGPHIRGAPPATVAALRSGFGSVGWDVAANAPAPGTAPPAAAAILELLAGTFAKLRPTLEAARGAKAQAATALSEGERELSFLEEDAAEGGLSAKQAKRLESLRGSIPSLTEALAAATELEAVVETSAGTEEVEALAAAERQQSTRIAATTAAMGSSAARRGGGGGGGGKGGPGGSGGGGRPNGGAGGGAGGAAAASGASGDVSSDISLVEASSLRKGGYLLINERPCRIKDLSSSKTGKHGSMKLRLVATDLESGKKVEDVMPGSSRVTVPGKRWIEALAPT